MSNPDVLARIQAYFDDPDNNPIPTSIHHEYDRDRLEFLFGIVRVIKDETDRLSSITTTDVLALLHMEDLALSDSSPHKLTTSKVGDTTRSSARKKFGNYSCLFDGDNDGLDVGTAAHFATGSGSFNYEFWVNITAFPASSQVGFEKYDGENKNSFEFKITSTGAVSSYFFNSVGARSDTLGGFNTSSGLVTLDTWHHISWSYSSEDFALRVFVDGVLVKTYSSLILDIGENHSLRFGITGAGFNDFNGYIDEVRVSRTPYTQAFTPATSPFEG